MSDIANLLLDQGGGTSTTGSSNAYLLNLPTQPTAYADNMMFVCKLNHTVTGPATMNVNGLGVKDFKKLVNGVAAPLSAGDGPAGHRPVCVYSSSENAVLMLLAAPTFTQAGSGAISWPMQDRMKEQVYLLDFIPQVHHAAIRDGTAADTAHANFFDCSDAIEDAMASLTVPHESSATYAGGPEIIFPYGHCYFSRTIELKKTLTLTGQAQGASNAYSTRLLFAAGITGITVNSQTSFEGDATPGTTGGDASTIRHLYLRSKSGGVPPVGGWDNDPDNVDHWIGHGIWCRARANIEHCRIQDFPNHGLYVQAAATVLATRPWLYGNANNMYVSHIATYSNGGCGVYIDGPDVNAGLFMAIDASSNLLSGIFESSLIFNTHVGHHCAGNGLDGLCSYATGPSPAISKRYVLIDDTLGPTIPPEGHAQSADVWQFYTNSSANPDPHIWYPPWPNDLGGVTPKTYRRGYNYWFDQGASININPYAEGAPGLPNYYTANSLVIGSQQYITDAAGLGAPTFIRGGGLMGSRFEIPSRPVSATDFSTHINFRPDESLTWVADGDSTSGVAFTFNSTDGTWDYMHGGAAIAQHPVRLTTNLTTLTGGRAANIAGGHIMFSRGLWLGSSTANSRYMTALTAVPTSGQWAAGDIVLNCAPLLGEPWGWRCILTGDFAATPPVFQPLRDTGSQQTISDGSAFTLTPGTSPYRTLYSGTMAANRTVTLSTTSALIGLSYRITRKATGAFSLNVGAGPLKALAQDTWCEVAYDGSAYYLSAYGTL